MWIRVDCLTRLSVSKASYMMLTQETCLLLTAWILFTCSLGWCKGEEICQTGRYEKKTCKYGCCSATVYDKCCEYVNVGLIVGVVLAGMVFVGVAVVVTVMVKRHMDDKHNKADIINTESADISEKRIFSSARNAMASQTNIPSFAESAHASSPV